MSRKGKITIEIMGGDYDSEPIFTHVETWRTMTDKEMWEVIAYETHKAVKRMRGVWEYKKANPEGEDE